MATCTMIAAIITCVMTGPRPTAAESAALLAPRQYVHVPLPAGPTVTVIAGAPAEGPFGAFPPERPAVRLDGSRLDDPPWLHVGYPGWGYGGWGHRGTVERRRPAERPSR